MKILFPYLKRHRGLIMLTLLLAAVNQVFSLFDPLIFQRFLDGTLLHIKENKLDKDTFLHLALVWFFFGAWNGYGFAHCQKFPGLFYECGHTKNGRAHLYGWT